MSAEPSESRRPGKKAYLLVSLLVVVAVSFPFLFIYQTWFGRKLTDSQIDDYFADKAKPRHAQQALVQVEERMAAHRDASRWYPKVVEQASSPSLEIRETAAWVMQYDRSYAPFHEALLRLIRDPQPMVRRNAALSLAAFGDAAARPELLAMLRPYTLTAPTAGVLKYRLKLGEYVNPGTLVAHMGDSEVRSPIPGEVRDLDSRDGTAIRSGDPLLDLSADKGHVWEALRALYLVGQPEDLEDVRRFTRPMPGMTENIQQQALNTIQAIEARHARP
ncbi:MAG TPA: HEAT repeat domain-containing protein [Candidatus Sulfopaludibacter sp.]|nr:HEAT repeat domain-containing protein [Candidatus Sulfopaludibacter sp.]